MHCSCFVVRGGSCGESTSVPLALWCGLVKTWKPGNWFYFLFFGKILPQLFDFLKSHLSRDDHIRHIYKT